MVSCKCLICSVSNNIQVNQIHHSCFTSGSIKYYYADTFALRKNVREKLVLFWFDQFICTTSFSLYHKYIYFYPATPWNSFCKVKHRGPHHSPYTSTVYHFTYCSLPGSVCISVWVKVVTLSERHEFTMNVNADWSFRWLLFVTLHHLQM